MARDIRDIVFRYVTDTKDLVRGTKQADKTLGGFSNTVRGLATVAAGAFSAQAVADWAGEAVNMAAAAEEVDSKFEAVFGTNEKLTESLEAWGDLAGVTTTQAKDLAATFGNLAIAQGMGADEAEDLAIETAKLAGDMASFNDADPSQVFNDLNKALLTTEREGMKKYGIAITESEVKQRALNLAVEDGRDEATMADRALASYQIAVEQAGKAVGDLERTQESTANQTRQLQATYRELQEEIGRELLPVWSELVSTVNDAAPAFMTMRRAAQSAIGDVVDWTNADLFLKPFEWMQDQISDTGDEFEDFGSQWDVVATAIETRTAEMARKMKESNEDIQGYFSVTGMEIDEFTFRLQERLRDVTDSVVATRAELADKELIIRARVEGAEEIDRILDEIERSRLRDGLAG